MSIPAPAPPPAPPQNAPRILAVDDEPIVVAALRETLIREGYHVTVVNGGEAALEVLQKEKFAVIISDHAMPDITGLELLAEAKRIQPHAARILITAVLDMNTVIDAINQGEVYRFMLKPWLREELLATVRSAVQRNQLLCANLQLESEHSESVEELRELRQANAALKNSNESLTARADASVQTVAEICWRQLHAFHPLSAMRSRRIRKLCRRIGEVAKLKEEDLVTLETAGLLCDVGLALVPRSVIRRQVQGGMESSPEQIALYQRHTVASEEILKSVVFPPGLGKVVRHHHESFDGSGYPDGLQSDRIPWLSRLLATAVTFAEHVGTDEDACRIVSEAAGTRLDPRAVEHFLLAAQDVQLPARPCEIDLARLQPGMVSASPVYGSSGQLLIAEGAALTAGSIASLQSDAGDHLEDATETFVVYC